MDQQLPTPPPSPPWGSSSSGGDEQLDDLAPPPDGGAASPSPPAEPPDDGTAGLPAPPPPMSDSDLGPSPVTALPPPAVAAVIEPPPAVADVELPPPAVELPPPGGAVGTGPDDAAELPAPSVAGPGGDRDAGQLEDAEGRARGDEDLVSLPLAARTRWRVQGAIVGLLLGLLTAVVPTGLLYLAVGGIAGAAAPVFALTGVAAGIAWANRRHERFGYRLDAERLRVRDGVVVHSDAVAPLFRVQHVDLTRGPLQLSFGLASLAVHTASPAADVRLPDLRAEDAERVRDQILTASKAAAAAVGTADADAV